MAQKQFIQLQKHIAVGSATNAIQFSIMGFSINHCRFMQAKLLTHNSGNTRPRVFQRSASYNSALCRSGFLLIACFIVIIPNSQHNPPQITAAFE